jgi:beta-galactosidase
MAATTRRAPLAARAAFRDWLAQRHQSIDALNRAWGNVFWSMEYDSFDEIDLPNLTVTEPNPAHVMAFRRFSSDQVVRFNRARWRGSARGRTRRSPQLHGPRARFRPFRRRRADLDIASWDSYPLGFLSDRLDPASTSAAISGRATRTSRPSTTTSTAPWAAAAGG